MSFKDLSKVLTACTRLFYNRLFNKCGQLFILEVKVRESQVDIPVSADKNFNEITPDSKYTNTINFYTKPVVKQHISDETASLTNSYFKEDTLLVDSRHSDSGYDTLQMGSVLSSKDPDIDRLLKFDFGKKANGIQNLIKNFEFKDMKEPLQSSSFRSNEAQISSLKKEDIRHSTAQNPQSVRDLLANFEKKKERCVFSDTETLLYETSSDTEPIISNSKHTEALSTDEDDPEVVDVLGQKSDPNDEQYYLPMTPSKKSSFEEDISKSKLVIVDTEDQENYVEMTQNSKPILAPSPKLDKKSHYEYIAYKTNSNYEPVYTEVKTKTLPDILKSSTNINSSIKSDSSDADDEASKDLDSLDTPCHPRFSLSDTFRPASYYLGAAINEDTHDSSDSDLVSPPPMNFDKDNQLKSIRKKMESLIQSASESDSDSGKKEKQTVFNGDLDSIGSRNGMYEIDINLDDYLDKQNIEECDRFYENYCKSLENRRLDENFEPPLGAPYYYSDISNGNLRLLTPESQGAEGFTMRRRSRSFEGVLDDSVYCNLEPRKCTSPKEAISRLLRTAEMKSPRATELAIVNLPLRSRSLDNLDTEPEKKTGRQSADILNSKRNEAMYVNEAVFDRHKEYKDDYRSVKKGRCKSGSQSFLEEGLYPMTRPPSMEQLDREKLRQWDLMSTVPAVMLGVTRAYSRTSERQVTLTPAESNTRPLSLSHRSDETPTSSPG